MIGYVFAHELGHWAWHNILTEEDRRNYRDIVGKPNEDDFELAQKYGVEPELLEMEWFAEDFRLYACGVIGETKSKLGMSRGSVSELKKFFQVFMA